jgi:hypothetical protein
MGLVIGVLQLLFVILMLGGILLFLFNFALAWAWSQHRVQAENEQISFANILTTASIEWIAMVILSAGQFRKLKPFFEAPPLEYIDPSELPGKQIPLIFIPSLHTAGGLFSILMWRLKKHFYVSLWPHSWKSFLKDSRLLEDELSEYIRMVLQKTKSPRFRVLSFGSSRRIVSRVLSSEEFSKSCDKWIALSAPETASSTMKFLQTERIKSSYLEDTAPLFRSPDLLIYGNHDMICYPLSVWGELKKYPVSPVGHYSLLVHPEIVQKVLEELS